MRAFTIIALCGITHAIKLTTMKKEKGGEEDITMDKLMDEGFDLVDENGDGEIDLDEGMKVAKKMRDVAVKRGLLEEGEIDDDDLLEGLEWAGEMADADGSGAISMDEMKKGMKDMMGELDLSEEDLAAMAIEVADEDGDGEVGMKEAKKLMKEMDIDVDDDDIKELGDQLDKDMSKGVDAEELLALAQLDGEETDGEEADGSKMGKKGKKCKKSDDDDELAQMDGEETDGDGEKPEADGDKKKAKKGKGKGKKPAELADDDDEVETTLVQKKCKKLAAADADEE